MSNVTIQPPEPFDTKSPSTWPRWKKRFERYRIASSLNEKSGEMQVSTLIYAMGPEAEDILASFGLSDDESKDYDDVMNKFDGYFVQRKSPIFERAKFNQRVQAETETVDQFVTALYALVEHCEYQGLKEQMIRDRLVVGLRDSKLSERLQLDSDLDLKKALAMARNSEAVRAQQSTVRGSTSTPATSDLAALHKTAPWDKKRGQRQRTRKPGQMTTGSTGSPQQAKTCSCCGRETHPRPRCPARDATCALCKKRGHFAAVCKSRPHQSMGAIMDDSDDSSAFLGALHDTSPAWTKKAFLAGTPVIMKVDTGADVTAISEEDFSSIRPKPQLDISRRVLRGPDGKPLHVVGAFNTPMSIDSCFDRSSRHTVYVIRGLHTSLLGRPAIQALHVLQRPQVDSLSAMTTDNPGYKNNVISDYPQLFTGLGEMHGTPHHIHLADNATPYSLSTPRRVPVPLIAKVDATLGKMESQGVIRRIDEPTEWCAGMVVVPKSNGDVGVCGDFTKLNHSIQRERHILPSVEHLLANIGNTTVFSKLDANSGFHQIPLDEASQRLTTFITPSGRYCYRRLPFGISSAPEFFQKRMLTILDGLPGVICLVDDILVSGACQEEHDERLQAVLQRLASAGLTLNGEKCLFSVSQLCFCGYLIGKDGIRPDPRSQP